jgi:Zn-dependent membrane protease YugP
MEDCLARLGLVTLVAAAPFAVTVGAAMAATRLRRGAPDPEVDTSAGAWLTSELARRGLLGTVSVGVTPALAAGVDAYWPAARFLGLSATTWASRRASARAVAAHELGHATWCLRGGLVGRAPELVHLAADIAGHAFVAGLLVAAVTGAGGALVAAKVALAVSLAAGIGVLADELGASARARATLRADSSTSAAAAAAGDRAMAAAAAAYAAPWLARLGLLLAFDAVVAPLAAAPPMGPAAPLDLAAWAVLGLAPALVLRAMQVLTDAWRRAPPKSGFHLAWTMDRERAWEMQTGVVVLAWLALTARGPLGDGLAGLAVLAAIPAVAPLAAMGRTLATLPIALALPRPAAPPREVRPADPVALALSATDPTVRAASLVRVAYVPLMVALVARALTAT